MSIAASQNSSFARAIVTLADVKPSDMQHELAVADPRLPAAVEHEAPSHRRLGSSEITVGHRSARFDHLTGRVHLAARNPGAPAVRPRTVPPAEQAHAPPRAAAMPAPSHRAITKAVPRQFAEIARHSPCSRANASRGYESVLLKSPFTTNTTRAVAAPEATEVVPSSRGGPRGQASAVFKRSETLERLSPDADRIDVGRIRRHSGKGTQPLPCAPPLRQRRRLPRPRRRSDQREAGGGRAGQSGDQRLMSDPHVRIGSMKLGRK